MLFSFLEHGDPIARRILAIDADFLGEERHRELAFLLPIGVEQRGFPHRA